MKKLLTALLLLALCFLPAVLAATKVANDPSRIAVGARLLGMGKSYIGMADDLEGIFTNPAGLASVRNWQLTSMSGKFINEYAYTNFGTAFPSPYGTFGLGYVSSSIGFIAPALTWEVVDGIRIIPASTEGSSYDYSNALMLFSWGAQIGDFPVGVTYKLFGNRMTGPGISGGTAAGGDIDLGIAYKPLDYIKLGAVAQNVLPAAMGGRVKWESGAEETLPALFKFGASIKMLGETGLNQFRGHELALNTDVEFTPLRPNIPPLYHLGLEWLPLQLLALRLGLDQETVGKGEGAILEPANNLTLGVGINLNDFRFDYAYHQYNHVTENDTHYFSITYGTGKKRVEKKGPPFTLQPADRSIIYDDKAAIAGRANFTDVAHLTVNNEEVPLESGAFRYPARLNPGKNYFTFQGFDAKWQRTDSAAVLRLLRLPRFPDVPEDHWALLPISQLNALGLISGFPDGTFRPEGEVTRAELCALLMKLRAAGPATAGPRFKDVPAKFWAADYIARAVGAEVVKGYPSGIFRPQGKITRAEGVDFIARFAELPEPALPEVPYPDVPGRHWAINYIAAAKQAGLLKYLEDKPFEPGKFLTRAEAAYMLASLEDLAKRIKDFSEW